MFVKKQNISLACLSALATLTVLVSSAAIQEVDVIPADINVCSDNAANINECLRIAFQTMLPRARKGIPAINLPPMEPFQLNRATYLFHNTILKGKIQLRNVKISGLTYAQMKKVDFRQNRTATNIYVETRIPKIQIDGGYAAKLKVNGMIIAAKGVFNVSMADLILKSRVNSEVFEQNNHDYLRVKTFVVDPTLGNMRVRATGLVDDVFLNNVLVDFVNQNWRNVYKSIVLDTQTTWEPELLKISNEYFSHIPLELMLPRKHI